MDTITDLRVYTPPGSRVRISPDAALTPDQYNTRLLRLFLARGYMCDEEPQALAVDAAEEPGWSVAINEANDWPAREVEVLVFSTEAIAQAAIAAAVPTPNATPPPAQQPELGEDGEILKAFTGVYNQRADGDYDFIMAVANDHSINQDGNQSIAEKMASDLRESGEEILLVQFDRLSDVVDVWSPKSNAKTNEVTS